MRGSNNVRKEKLPKYIQKRWGRWHAQGRHSSYGTVHLGTFATLDEALERQEEFKRTGK